MTPRRPQRRPLSALLGTALAGVVTGGLLMPAPAAHAADLPTGFRARAVARGLVAPVDLEVAPDGRLFLAEQAGRVRVRKADGTVVTFLNLGARVDHTDERGLSGIALDPNFAANRFVYLDYTRRGAGGSGPRNEVIRVKARGSRVVPGSEKRLFRLDPQISTHHIGGSIEFGADGKLYVTAGDNQRPGTAQRLGSLHGKVLRLNKDGSIPGSNPFVGRTTGRNRAIWARGLRNPFKLTGTGSTLFVNDVGETSWEEVDRLRRGRNYGWPAKEGPESAAAYEPPVFAYRHGPGNRRGCAITGGTFYDPASATFPAGMVGDYFFADLCNGWIRRYDVATDSVHRFATAFPQRQLVDLAVDPQGGLLVLRLNGVVTRIVRPS